MNGSEKNFDRGQVYRLSLKDWIVNAMAGAGLTVMILLIFYRSTVLAACGGILMMVLFPLYRRKDIFAAQKQQITMEFKESLFILSASLRAGESLESAFRSTVEEMELSQFPHLYKEWRAILARMQLHQSLEMLLSEYAARTRIDEIMSFASIIAVSKRTQGDITSVIDHTAGLLQEKIEMQQELVVILARKKTEQRIMNVMPMVVIAMLTTMSPDYVAPLYSTIEGRLVMTVCILLACASLLIARHIANIVI